MNFPHHPISSTRTAYKELHLRIITPLANVLSALPNVYVCYFHCAMDIRMNRKLPYSALFSRCLILRISTKTRKLCPRINLLFLVGWVCDLLNFENYSAKSFSHGNPRKISTSKIERHTVYITLHTYIHT